MRVSLVFLQMPCAEINRMEANVLRRDSSCEDQPWVVQHRGRSRLAIAPRRSRGAGSPARIRGRDRLQKDLAFLQVAFL